jgi:hypothetical protein
MNLKKCTAMVFGLTLALSSSAFAESYEGGDDSGTGRTENQGHNNNKTNAGVGNGHEHEDDGDNESEDLDPGNSQTNNRAGDNSDKPSSAASGNQ